MLRDSRITVRGGSGKCYGGPFILDVAESAADLESVSSAGCR